MAHDDKGVVKEVEWSIKVEDGPWKRARISCSMCVFISSLYSKLCKFMKKAWEIGVNDPRKFIHCLKVGIALTAVSLFYYLNPLYDGVGRNAMWAVMTVVVVFEYTAGSTIYKSVNRICGTTLAGLLAFGVQWVASKAGKQLEPVIVGVLLFLLGSAATFSRFIPTIKARFDYGVLIFILTFSLVSISGYRIDELFDMAQQRISTIIIGTSLCIIVSMIIRPVWAGLELYVLVTGNLDKLANSLEGCVAQYFEAQSTSEESNKKLMDYKCVLNSKATEVSMANLARWEPAHGRFNFRHPWKQYLEIGATMRRCASCIDALVGCINSENKSSDEIKKIMSTTSMKVGANSASVLRELSITINNMTKSKKLDSLVKEMNIATQELQNLLKSYSNTHNVNAKETSSLGDAKMEIPIMEVIQVVTVISLLIETVARVEDIVKSVEELSKLAKFKPEMSKCDKSKQRSTQNKILPDQHDEEATIKTLQIV
ncbi:putative aluminum-activated malate transporter [Medicago truncatula]|uniref:Aluminum activated malate transporter family protein n=1 Tax=Medicago truncatula TaxID=3880 RepID=A0A072VMR8_MEDTR|nr:aluminum activated malate transporter family protein [Medicago truncatula]RHN80491.1 putative aluminum-activated malate transporter [Medicago truncatula]